MKERKKNQVLSGFIHDALMWFRTYDVREIFSGFAKWAAIKKFNVMFKAL